METIIVTAKALEKMLTNRFSMNYKGNNEYEIKISKEKLINYVTRNWGNIQDIIFL